MRIGASRREQMNKQIEEIQRKRRWRKKRRRRRRQLAATCKQIPRPSTVIKMLL